jgi:hypothetical protein
MNYTPAEREKPILFDTCIFMVGIDKRQTNSNYSLENMRKLWMDCVLNYFSNILIHQVVCAELDKDTRCVIDGRKNITTVDDADLLNKDPEYTRVFNLINSHPLLFHPSVQRKNQGEVHTLAYAYYRNIPFFSSRDSDACDVCSEIDELKDITVVGFETLLGLAYSDTCDSEIHRGQKALYKEFCGKKIKRGIIPETLSEYMGM